MSRLLPGLRQHFLRLEQPSARFRRLALTLGLHAAVDLFGNLLGQVDAGAGDVTLTVPGSISENDAGVDVIGN